MASAKGARAPAVDAHNVLPLYSSRPHATRQHEDCGEEDEDGGEEYLSVLFKRENLIFVIQVFEQKQASISYITIYIYLTHTIILYTQCIQKTIFLPGI